MSTPPGGAVARLARAGFSNAYLLLTLATLCWGANAVVGRFAADLMTPATLTFLRWLIAVGIVYALARPHLRADWVRLRASWGRVFLYGGLGFAGFNLCLYSALHYTTAINASIEQAGMPMLIIVANFLLFGQLVRAVQVLGVLVTVAGVLVTASHGDLAVLLALDLNRGDAIMLLAVLLYGGYAVALRFRPQMHWLSLLFGMSVGALAVVTPVMLWEAATIGFELPGAVGWAVVAFVVAFPTLVSQLFFMRGVELIGPNRAGLFINLVPIFGAGLAVALLGEPLEAYHLVGLALVLGGIGVAERFAPR